MLLVSYCVTAIITSTVRRRKEAWTAIIMKYHFAEETVRLSSRKNSFFHHRFPDFFPLQPVPFLPRVNVVPRVSLFHQLESSRQRRSTPLCPRREFLRKFMGAGVRIARKFSLFAGPRPPTYVPTDIRTLCRQKLADRETTWKRSAPIVGIVRDRAFRLFPIHRLEFLF